MALHLQASEVSTCVENSRRNVKQNKEEAVTIYVKHLIGLKRSRGRRIEPSTSSSRNQRPNTIGKQNNSILHNIHLKEDYNITQQSNHVYPEKTNENFSGFNSVTLVTASKKVLVSSSSDDDIFNDYVFRIVQTLTTT